MSVWDGTVAAPAAGQPAHASGGRGRSTDWAPVPTEEITFAGPAGALKAAWAPAERARGGVLVIHENRGLNTHIRQVAGRFAATGWSALALDLLSRRGGTGAFPTEAEVTAALNQLAATPEVFDADKKAAVNTGARFSAPAAAEAWRRVIGWFDRAGERRG